MYDHIFDSWDSFVLQSSERVVFFNSDSVDALFGLERMFWGLKVTICLPHTSFFLKSSKCHEKATWSFLYAILNKWFISNKSNTDENTELADTQLRSRTFCAGFLQKRLGLFENANAQRAVEVSSGQETDPDTGENSEADLSWSHCWSLTYRPQLNECAVHWKEQMTADSWWSTFNYKRCNVGLTINNNQKEIEHYRLKIWKQSTLFKWKL